MVNLPQSLEGMSFIHRLDERWKFGRTSKSHRTGSLRMLRSTSNFFLLL